MINKILIAEDQEIANISVQKTLQELKITDIDYTYYCDDALERIKNCVRNQNPYDLLITDLYFEEDERPQTITGGAELIKAARLEQPDLKVLVFSAEGKPAAIEKLFTELQIDAYVRKARHDAKELKSALDNLTQNRRYYPRHIQQLINQKNSHLFTPYDITIISLLAEGKRMKQIVEHLKQHDIQPSGLSSIEKRLAFIKQELEFSNNEQLIAYCKDMGII